MTALTGFAQAMVTLLSLPPEVLGHVAKHLDDASLRRLALVCRYVSEPARLERRIHPRLGLYERGKAFRDAFGPSADDPRLYRFHDVGHHFRVTTFECTDWTRWQPSFNFLAPLPNLSVVVLKNLSQGREQPLPMFSAIETLHRHPRIASLTLVCPESERTSTNGSRMDALTHLVFTAVTACLSPPAISPRLASHCPNVQSIILLQPTGLDLLSNEDPIEPLDPLGGRDLLFLCGFPRLADLELVAYVEHAMGRDVAQAVSRLRNVSLTSYGPEEEGEEYYTLLPAELFKGDHPRLESIYLNLHMCAPNAASTLLQSIVAGHFPALLRLKIVKPYPLILVSDDEEYDPRHDLCHLYECQVYLKQQGFVIHECDRCAYAEKPRPGRTIKQCRRGHREKRAREKKCPSR